MKKIVYPGYGIGIPFRAEVNRNSGRWLRIASWILLTVLAIPSVMAQEEEIRERRQPGEVQTLFNPNAGSGGYGAISLGYTSIAGRDAILMGGRGEWIIGHGFGLGVGGYGFLNDAVYDAAQDLNFALAGGYGGLVMEPIILGWFPVHVAVPVLIGAGGVASTSFTADWNDPYEYWDGYLEDAAGFFVAEAGLELEFNLVRFFRLSLFGTYRYTSDIIMETTPEDALRGWNYGITMKFGSF
ncbi:MAG: hypothetical protein EHM46_02670 [Bacteroidetes bacterium]|nr:MAG: hypothetical protein EHM46_02670 [Bacteroidota bacterium]